MRKLKKLNQDDFKMKLIEDLGMQLPKQDSKTKRRLARFKCNGCKQVFTTFVTAAKSNKQEICLPCANKIRAITHGLTDSRIYTIFKGMKNRCYNKKNEYYEHYGEKGITICEEWLHGGLKVFNKWAQENGYTEELSIDRRDNDKGYSPDNCRWTTQNVQSQNTKQLRSTNTSGYRGVSLSHGKWKAQICHNSKTKSLGVYATPLEAAIAYDNYIDLYNTNHTKNNIKELDEKS